MNLGTIFLRFQQTTIKNGSRDNFYTEPASKLHKKLQINVVNTLNQTGNFETERLR